MIRRLVICSALVSIVVASPAAAQKKPEART